MATHDDTTTLRDRIGIALRLDDDIPTLLEWAGANGIRVLDFHLDDRGPDPAAYSAETVEAIGSVTEEYGIDFGLHALSAVNTAETEPIVGEAVEDYLIAYIDLAAHLGAEYVVHHPGFHFTEDRDERLATAIERLRTAGEYARENDVKLTCCNMNPEPADSEIDYLGSTLEECQRIANEIPAGAQYWAFNAPHAHLTDAGIDGFIDGLDADRIGLVRLNDNRGEREEHLAIGEGTIDFERTVHRLERSGFDGHYIIAYGSNEDMLEERETLLDLVGPVN